MIAMIASAIADSISRWCRSSIRWRSPTYFTAARPEGVLSTREIAGGRSPAATWTCLLTAQLGRALAGIAYTPPRFPVPAARERFRGRGGVRDEPVRDRQQRGAAGQEQAAVQQGQPPAHRGLRVAQPGHLPSPMR